MRLLLTPLLLTSLSTGISLAAEEAATETTEQAEAITEEEMAAALAAIQNGVAGLSVGETITILVPNSTLIITVTAHGNGIFSTTGLPNVASIVLTPASEGQQATIAIDADGDGLIDSVRLVTATGVSEPLEGDALAQSGAPTVTTPIATLVPSNNEGEEALGNNSEPEEDQGAALGNLGGTGPTTPQTPVNPATGAGGATPGDSNTLGASPTL